MIICLAITNFPPHIGGISTFYKNLSDLLTGQNHHVIILTTDYLAADHDEDQEIREQFRTRVILKKSYCHLRKKYRAYFRPGGLDAGSWIGRGLAMRNWLLSNHHRLKIDIIQTVDYGGLGFFLADNKLPPIVVFGHGCLLQVAGYNHIENDAHAQVIKQLEQFGFKKASTVVTHSYINQTQLKQLTGKDILLTLAPWVQQAPVAAPIPKGKTVLVVSALSAVKGTDTMAKAVQLYCVKNPSFRLRWIGGDTFSAENSSSMAKYLQNEYGEIWQKNFIWLNEKKPVEIRREILRSLMVAIPSQWETFSWVALEAAALGKAVIMTATTGASYLFTHGHDAWIIPPNNPEVLAEAIAMLSNDQVLCQQLGLRASEMMQRTFNDENNLAEKINIYRHTILTQLNQEKSFEQDMLILKKYTTKYRKIKYMFRAVLKKIASRP